MWAVKARVIKAVVSVIWGNFVLALVGGLLGTSSWWRFCGAFIGRIGVRVAFC